MVKAPVRKTGDLWIESRYDTNFSLKISSITGHATKCHRRFPKVYTWFSSVVRQKPGNLLHCPQYPPIPSSPSSFSLLGLTDETDVTDPGQMAYQAGNPWLRPKRVGSRRSLRAPQALPGKLFTKLATGNRMSIRLEINFIVDPYLFWMA